MRNRIEQVGLGTEKCIRVTTVFAEKKKKKKKKREGRLREWRKRLKRYCICCASYEVGGISGRAKVVKWIEMDGEMERNGWNRRLRVDTTKSQSNRIGERCVVSITSNVIKVGSSTITEVEINRIKRIMQIKQIKQICDLCG